LGVERDTPRGWAYEVTLRREGLGQSEHVVTLSWVDHDYWSGGSAPPSRVVEAVLKYALENAGHEAAGAEVEWPARFDASRVRRWFPRLDEELRVGA
jgi:hypothetical protein